MIHDFERRLADSIAPLMSCSYNENAEMSLDDPNLEVSNRSTALTARQDHIGSHMGKDFLKHYSSEYNDEVFVSLN